MREQNALIVRGAEPPDVELVQGNSISSTYGFEKPAGRGHLRDYWLALKKYAWLIIVITLTATAVVTVYVAQKPNVYRAGARVQVNLESNPALGDGKSVVISSMGYDPAYFSTQLQILEGSGMLRRVVRTIDLEHNQAFLNPAQSRQRSSWQNVLHMFGLGEKEKPADASLAADSQKAAAPGVLAKASGNSSDDAEELAPYVGMIKGGLRISPVKENRVAYKETRLIDIEYTHYDPHIAAKVANAIADVYVTSNLEKKVESNSTAGDFLQKRVAELQSQIRSGEEWLLNYSKNNAILSLNGEQNTVVQRLADLNGKLMQAQSDRITAEAEYRASLAPGAARTLAEGSDARFSQGESKLAELRQRREQLLVDYTEEWDEVVEVDRQIAAIQSDLQESRQRSSNNITANLEIKYRQASAREQELKKDFDKQRGEVLSQNEAAINYRIIEQEIDTNKTLLNGLLQRSRENDVILNGTPNNVLVVDRALTPKAPIGPQRYKYIVLAFFASLFSGVALAFALRYLDDSVRTSEDVESLLMLPVIAPIPTFHRPAHTRLLHSAFSRRRAAKLKGGDALLAINTDPATNEAFMHLRTSVLLASAGGPPKTILITSGEASEGKTSVACNLTAVLAQQAGAKVVIVDADMRRPNLHAVYNVANGEGLSNILAQTTMDEDEVLSRITYHEKTGVYLLTAGAMPPNPPDLLGSPQMRRLVYMLESHFTHVIIDSPPVIFFTDSTIISTMVDGVMLVVRSGKSSREVAQRAQKMLQDVGAKIIGVVINALPTASTNYYKYGYGYGPPPPDSPDAEVEPMKSKGAVLGLN